MHRNQQLVEQAFNRWSTGQGSVLDLMDDDGTVVIPGSSAHCGTRTKREFVKDVATPFMRRFSTPPVPLPTRIIADDDDVIVVADAHGVTLDGKAYRNHYVFILEFKEDSLVQATEFLDMVAFNVVWNDVEPRAQDSSELERSL